MPRGRRKNLPEDARAFLNEWGKTELPNHGSQFQTPSTLAIDLRYAELHIFIRWNWERYARLAKVLNITAFELASIVCLNHSLVPDFKQRDRLPQSQRAVALLLTMLEAHVCGPFTSDVIENPLPDLGAAPHEQPENP